MDGIGVRSWAALGMQVEVLTEHPAALSGACAAVEQVLAQADAALSRFRADSELSRVNANAGRAQRVTPFFGGALMAALRAARRTDGAVDPTVGSALRRLGYDRDFDLIPPRGPVPPAAHRVPGWREIDFDPLTLRLRIPAGAELDLGCTGKAVTVDLAAEAARDAAGGGVLIGIGGDLRCAGPAPPEGWQVLACEGREGPGASPQVIAVTGGALATSSTTARRWQRGDETLHHLVDPATGRPAEGPLRTATVAGASCVDANLVATWALIRGEAALAWLRQHPVPARLIRRDGSPLYLGGWPVPAPPARAAEGRVA